MRTRTAIKSRLQGVNGSTVRGSGGFTLIELLVALMIMAILSVLAYSAFDGILALEQRSKEEFMEENRRQLASSIMLNDFLHMRARPARDALGGTDAAYLAPSGDYEVVFTRGGLPDFSAMRGGIQRIGYRLESGRLIRTVWDVVDQAPVSEARDQVLATGLRELEMEHLNREGEYSLHWPPANERLQPQRLPMMVRITTLLANGDRQTLLIPGPDGYGSPGASAVGARGL